MQLRWPYEWPCVAMIMIMITIVTMGQTDIYFTPVATWCEARLGARYHASQGNISKPDLVWIDLVVVGVIYNSFVVSSFGYCPFVRHFCGQCSYKFKIWQSVHCVLFIIDLGNVLIYTYHKSLWFLVSIERFEFSGILIRQLIKTMMIMNHNKKSSLNLTTQSALISLFQIYLLIQKL